MNARDHTARDAADTLESYDERIKRHAHGFGPAPRAKPAGSFRIDLTEKQRQELEKYIEEHQLPF